MSRSSRRTCAVTGLPVVLLLTSSLALAACTGSRPAPAAPSPASTQSQLQDQLDVLPSIDGAHRTAQNYRGTTLTETFAVPSGSPACLQVLARLDAGGYEVVTGANQTAVVASTCTTSAGDTSLTTSAGTATILARGGSEIALTWTASAYTVSVSAS